MKLKSLLILLIFIPKLFLAQSWSSTTSPIDIYGAPNELIVKGDTILIPIIGGNSQAISLLKYDMVHNTISATKDMIVSPYPVTPQAFVLHDSTYYIYMALSSGTLCYKNVGDTLVGKSMLGAFGVQMSTNKDSVFLGGYNSCKVFVTTDAINEIDYFVADSTGQFIGEIYYNGGTLYIGTQNNTTDLYTWNNSIATCYSVKGLTRTNIGSVSGGRNTVSWFRKLIKCNGSLYALLDTQTDTIARGLYKYMGGTTWAKQYSPNLYKISHPLSMTTDDTSRIWISYSGHTSDSTTNRIQEYDVSKNASRLLPKITIPTSCPSPFAIKYYRNTIYGMTTCSNTGYTKNNIAPLVPVYGEGDFGKVYKIDPRVPGTFYFKTPANNSIYAPGDTIHFSWHASILGGGGAYDSTALILPTGTVKVYNDSTYDYISPDTLLNFYCSGYSYSEVHRIDKKLIFFKGGHKYLVIENVQVAGSNVSITTKSLNVDSLRYYANGVLFATQNVNKTLNPNFTLLNINLIEESSPITIKVEEYRDTTRIIKQLTSYKSVGSLYDGRICYSWGGVNAFETGWVLDLSCGWNSSLNGTPGITTLFWDTFSNQPVFKRHQDQEQCSHRKCCQGSNGSVMYIEGQGLVTEGGDARFMEPFSISTVATCYCPQNIGNLTYNGWTYHISGYFLNVDDIVNHFMNMKYLDITELVHPSDPWRTPLFTSGDFNFGAYLYPYETIIEQAFTLHPNSHPVEYNSGCSRPEYVNCPTISQAEIAATVMPRYFTPQLILQDAGGLNAAISVPLLKARDLSPLLSDTWTGVHVKMRNYFRGIYPRAIKYYRAPAGK